MGEYWFRSQWSDYPLPPLHRCCRDGDVESLASLLEGDRLEVFHSVCQQDRFLTWTPAHWASFFGKLECLRRLVACGLNINIIDGRFHQTPAHVAAFAGHPRMLLWMLQSGADINRKDSLGETVVHKAARGDHIECLTLLQAHGACMDIPSSKGETACELAMSLSHTSCANYLKQFTPSAWHQRECKRSHDDDEDDNGYQSVGNKRAKNGFVQHQNPLGIQDVDHRLPELENMGQDESGFHNGYNGLNCGDILNNNNITALAENAGTDGVSAQHGDDEDNDQTMDTAEVDADTAASRSPRCVAICPHFYDYRVGYFY